MVIEYRTYPKAFIRSLIMFHHNLRNTEKFFTDKRMTQEEKTVLKGWFLLRKNKLVELQEMILSMSSSQYELVESQKNLLLGITYNNLGQMNEARSCLEAVPEIVLKFPIRALHFMAFYNLCVCYYNQKDAVKLAQAVSKMEAFSQDSARHLIMQRQCVLMNALLNEDNETAIRLIAQLDSDLDKMSESMKLGHLYDKFNFLLLQNKLKDCLDCLWQMKKIRSFNSSENYNYLKGLLELLVLDRPLYIYSQQFKMNHQLFYQLKVIQSLQSMDIKVAEIYWSKLHKLDPSTYLEHFQLKDQKSLLAYALTKFKNHLTFNREDIDQKYQEGSKEKLLFGLLTQTSHPISKEIIHQLLWKKNLMDKQDMVKLKKLVSRVRSLYKLDIKYKNGCYFLNEAKHCVA